MRRLALILGCCLLALAGRAEDSVSWEITPPVAGPGQPFRLQVRIESDVVLGPADRVGRELRPPRGMALRFSGQVFRSGTTEATLNFSGVAPEEEGAHVIPSFSIRFPAKAIKVPDITLNVSRTTGYRKEGQARAELELPNRTFYVGERIQGVVRLRGSDQESVAGFFGLEGEAEGFTYEWTTDSPNKELPNGQGFETTFTLTPLRTGSSEIILNGIMLVQSGGANAFGSAGRDRPFTFRRRLTVEHVPETGRPADWNGAIGRFTAEAIQVSNPRPEVGEPVRMRVILSGEGNLDRIIPPEVVGGDAWDVVPTTERRRRAEDQRIFAYTLIPRLPGKQLTPPVRLSAFDPETRAFSRLEFPPQEVTVTGNAPAKVELVTIDPSLPKDAPAPKKISGLAAPMPTARGLFESPVRIITPLAVSPGFWAANGVLILSGSVLLTFALVTGYVATHPEVVRRWNARRALRSGRRAALRARRRGDEAAFAAAVVGALRRGCGPLLGAEPLALTHGDVHRAMPDSDEALVTKLFQAADGDKFGATPTITVLNEADLALALLTRLEERLS